MNLNLILRPNSNTTQKFYDDTWSLDKPSNKEFYRQVAIYFGGLILIGRKMVG